MAWLAERKAEDAHFVLKYVLRSLATVFSLISVGLLSAAFTSTPFGGAYEFEGALIFYIPAWVISILWNLVWMLIMIARTRQIVPGLVVAFDLIIWMYYVFPQVWGWFYFADLISEPYYEYGYYSEVNYDANAESYAAGTTGAGSVFAFLATCLHFVLFVIACIDEDRRRRRLNQQTTPFAPVAAVGAAPVMACNTTHCVDCHQPIELRCKQCSVAPPTSAAAPALGNTIGSKPPVLNPIDLESGRYVQEAEKSPSYVSK